MPPGVCTIRRKLPPNAVPNSVMCPLKQRSPNPPSSGWSWRFIRAVLYRGGGSVRRTEGVGSYSPPAQAANPFRHVSVDRSSASRNSRSAVARACASSVSGGLLPFGGSTINDVRRLMCLNDKNTLLYAPATSRSLPRCPRLSPSAFCCPLSRPARCSSSSACSSSVRYARFPYRSDRSKGVSNSSVQMPWRSGSPHGVRREGSDCVPVAVCPVRPTWVTRPTNTLATSGALTTVSIRTRISILPSPETEGQCIVWCHSAHPLQHRRFARGRTDDGRVGRRLHASNRRLLIAFDQQELDVQSSTRSVDDPAL